MSAAVAAGARRSSRSLMGARREWYYGAPMRCFAFALLALALACGDDDAPAAPDNAAAISARSQITKPARSGIASRRAVVVGNIEQERPEPSESAASILLFGFQNAARLCGCGGARGPGSQRGHFSPDSEEPLERLRIGFERAEAIYSPLFTSLSLAASPGPEARFG